MAVLPAKLSSTLRRSLPLSAVLPSALLAISAILKTHSAYAATFTDPLSGATPFSILGNLANFLLGLIGILSVVALIWGALRLVLSLGNEQQTATAKRIILWALIGLSVAILALVIISTLINNILT